MRDFCWDFGRFSKTLAELPWSCKGTSMGFQWIFKYHQFCLVQEFYPSYHNITVVIIALKMFIMYPIIFSFYINWYLLFSFFYNSNLLIINIRFRKKFRKRVMQNRRTYFTLPFSYYCEYITDVLTAFFSFL